MRGVRQNNLKNFDLDLPLRQLIVVTGLSGSGKSSLAFETLFAEGQRRYIETFSPYARQFLDRMDKPQVDSIEGIPPAIAIEQRNSVKTTRSTVGTMTEICDYAKLLWTHLAHLHCRNCGRPVLKDSPRSVWEQIAAPPGPNADLLITFTVPLSEKISLEESLTLVGKQGYQRLLLDGKIVRLPDATSLVQDRRGSIVVVQDKLRASPANRARFVEACEQAYHFGKGKLAVHTVDSAGDGVRPAPRLFSNRVHCAACDLEYREPVPALFSFNHPLGACPSCRGFGRTIAIDYNLAVPDRSRTLGQGAVKPWLTGTGAESQTDLLKFCRARRIPIDVPLEELPQETQDWLLNGDPDYGKDAAHEWPRAWYGVKGYFRWLESKAYKMHVRVLLSRYRSYTPCLACGGRRFQPESLLYTLARPGDGEAMNLAQFYELSIDAALAMVDALSASRDGGKLSDPLNLALHEVRSRLAYLVETGLGYLTLGRPTRTLSGGETERVNLTTSLGSRLVNTLFVLDEPTVGLHARDTERLVGILQKLRDAGNTVLVVEHEPGVMRAANHIVDLGPGHGESGGEVVFQGTYREILSATGTLTGEYLSGRRRIEGTPRRPVEATTARLALEQVSVHNLRNLDVGIPLGRLVCLTGVSGSGKTTLMRDALLPILQEKLRRPFPTEGGVDDEEEEERETDEGEPVVRRLTGWEKLEQVVLVDQSALGRTPRSNPAVYIGAFDSVREIFADTELAQQRGLGASAFSFNSAQGQCERCRGAGFEKIEMQFLSDVFIRCPECQGRRYRAHILEVKVSSAPPAQEERSVAGGRRRKQRLIGSSGRSIADVLEMTVDDAIAFLSGIQSRHAAKAARELSLLQEVGLGYLRLGQPINTLSGGESQRLKLVQHLAESNSGAGRPALFLFDEPTTGLHFDDVRVLLGVFQRLVNAGHSVVIIEHNLEVIKSADWVIDLGPEAGEGGGRLVAEGTPAEIAACAESHTGRALASLPGVVS